jgi:ABC-type Fe3+/spermidine/putrescine transport system ATPase subunit
MGTNDNQNAAGSDTQGTSTEDLAFLDVRNLTKIYDGEILAVNDLSFTVGDGEFCVIIGPSGCGKTTTLHSLVGKLTPTEGRVFLDGKDITETPTYERDIGLVFQDFQLFPHLDVEENIRYGLEEIDVPSAEQDERVEEMLNLMRITDIRNRSPEELSAGQQQRVALARSLVLEPKVLLLDEPLGDLDYKMQKRLELELLRIHREFEITFVYITHDQNQAMRLGDKIIVLNDGRLEQSGSVDDVYHRPATAFTAAFVGDSNIFYGELTEVSDDGRVAMVETEFGAFSVGTGNLDSKPETVLGRELSFAIRPQLLEPEAVGTNALACRVDDRIYQPGTGTLVLLTATGEDDTEKQIQLRTPEKAKFDTDRMDVGFDPEDGILLEKTSVAQDVDLQKDILGE